jgi:hypothetical protein
VGKVTDIAAGRQENGKGANFVTRPNPFSKKRAKSSTPQLADTAMVAQAIDRVLTSGCAIMLGQTRDGGALVITILEGDNRHRTYCSDEQELDDAVTAMYENYAP